MTKSVSRAVDEACSTSLIGPAISRSFSSGAVVKVSTRRGGSKFGGPEGPKPTTPLTQPGFGYAYEVLWAALDAKHSTEMEPYHSHTHPEPLNPGEVYKFEISIEPNAFRFKQGNRVRLEIVNGDSPITDVLWTHYYQPNKIGQDTLYHSAKYPSALILPVHE